MHEEDMFGRIENYVVRFMYNFKTYFFSHCHHMFLWTLVVLPPSCGDSVADFWGWDAHEAQLRCPDDVSGGMQEDEITGGVLSLNLLTIQTMVTAGIFPCKEKFPW